MACQVDQFIDGGDHWIITGRVVDLYQSDTEENPILYYKGGYRKLQP